MWSLLLTTAFAGYGDAVDGFPSRTERELLLWTNAARVAPAAFDDDYRRDGCRFDDFDRAEQSAKRPLAWNLDLNRAARVHSEDMRRNSFVAHESSDGTGTFERIAQYYRGGSPVGENVAGGQQTAREVVLESWMCSPGHRSNIMEGAYAEFGGGQDSVFWTQVFAGRNIERPVIPVGVHTPEVPRSSARFYAVFDGDGREAEALVVVVDGVARDLGRYAGTRELGVFDAEVQLDAALDCHQYWFEAVVRGVTHRFPEEGAWGFGACAFDDDDAGWFDADAVVGGGLGADDKYLDLAGGRGCDSVGGAGGWALLALLGLRRRRATG